MRKLDGKYTKVGYFRSQGMHTGADGIADYSYAALAQALEIGYFPMLKDVKEGYKFKTPMPFMNSIVNLSLQSKKRSPVFNRPWKKWLLNLDKNESPDILLDAIGRLAVNKSKEVFNNKAFFPQAPTNLTPLFETGELMKHYAFRTSSNSQVRKK